jgi:hypothetical protein
VLVLAALTAVGCRAQESPVRYGPVSQPLDPAQVPDCLNDKLRSFGMGLTEYKNEDEARKAFGDVMLWPDPATIPPDAKFGNAYFNASQQGAFVQSTMGLFYTLGDPTKETKDLNITYLTQIWPFDEPEEAHRNTTVRGGKTAYTFEPPFRKGMHSIQWQEGCRLGSVFADLPADQILRITEGLHFPTPGPNNYPTPRPAK